ncbi:MAG TPA: hypothetical protein VFK16_05235 [Gemmatimonadaceae bacterium]|nr:hypothetical protein [Gemmatimonadaceae bacterium]
MALPLSCMCAALAGALLAAGPLAAQAPTRPYRDWRTLTTAHFSFHYPRELEAWTRLTASHVEAVDSAVSALVGYSPAHHIDVVVDDPYGQSNGSAIPFVRSPVLTFWPVPPSPRSTVGNSRTWGEMLSVHEFGHLAHLMRPSRNPAYALLWSLAPVDVGPLATELPRWVIEGYATFIEGRITGSGRPNNAWRAAILRQWALEGKLPTYDEMSASSAYLGGSYAYLVGSAFLGWLAQRGGDSSLVHVWRRGTARVGRSFDAAFAGVYGDAPRVLYGRFVAQLMAEAIDASRAIDSAGLMQGALDQHLDWGTGDPALSPDGKRLALVLSSADAPPRTVIWSTAPPPVDTAAERRVRRMLARDPEDVAPRSIYPRPRVVLATLPAVAGQAFASPRFLPDGKRLLVVRATQQRDGSTRSDLYLWTPASGAVRRLTVDAGVQTPDPSPDGRNALATQCAQGTCSVVRIALATGRVTVLLAGTPARSYYHPRYAPDGATFVVSVSDGGRWRLAVADRDGGGLSYVGPDDRANRFDATFRPDGKSLVFSSDAHGTMDLAELDLRTDRVRQLTRVTGAAVAPVVDPIDESIWFLSLHARGWDLRRLPADSAAHGSLSLVGRFGAAAPPSPVERDTMPANAVLGPTGYGLGPRTTRYLPGGVYGPDGWATTLFLTNVDVIGRLTAFAGGAAGARPQWNGATGGAALRIWRVQVDARGHWARRLASTGSVAGPAGTSADVTRKGGLMAAAYESFGDQWRWRARAGGGYELVRPAALPTGLDRTLGFMEWTGAVQQSSGDVTLGEALAVHADAGRTGQDDVRRLLVRAGASLGRTGSLPLAATFTYGRMTGSSLPFERFSAGGSPSPLVDSSLTSASFAMPGLPNGAITAPASGPVSALYHYRISGPMGLLTPFYEAVAVTNGGSPARWHRVAGFDLHLQMASLAGLYLPGLSVSLGLARSFDAPFANRYSTYFSMRVLP